MKQTPLTVRQALEQLVGMDNTPFAYSKSEWDEAFKQAESSLAQDIKIKSVDKVFIDVINERKLHFDNFGERYRQATYEAMLIYADQFKDQPIAPKNLFVKKDFIMHSGEKGDFKIECDALSDEDIETLAYLISKKFKFHEVIGVPKGGLKLEKALKKYISFDSTTLLIVDDVLTTGKSMDEFRDGWVKKVNGINGYIDSIQGAVIFDRSNGKCPDWIQPLFTLDSHPTSNSGQVQQLVEAFRKFINKMREFYIETSTLEPNSEFEDWLSDAEQALISFTNHPTKKELNLKLLESKLDKALSEMTKEDWEKFLAKFPDTNKEDKKHEPLIGEYAREVVNTLPPNLNSSPKEKEGLTLNFSVDFTKNTIREQCFIESWEKRLKSLEDWKERIDRFRTFNI